MKRFVGIVLRKLWLRSSLLLLPALVGAQDIPIGTWRTHFSYTNARSLVRSKDKVFCAVDQGLFSVNIADRSTRKLSKVDGLSGVEVSALEYNENLNVLAIGYTSGYIDLIFEDKIVTVSEIATSSLDGEKKVNSLQFFGSQVLAATGLGIVVAETANGEIKENYIQIGVAGAEVETSQVVIMEGLLFAKTGEGIQSGPLESNLLDFSNWTHYQGTSILSDLTVSGGEIFARSGQDLLQLVNDSWMDTMVDLPAGASQLFGDQERIFSSTSTSVYVLEGMQFELMTEISTTQVNDLLLISDELWIASEHLGLIDGEGEKISPDGPFSNDFSQLRVVNNSCYGFHAPDARLYSGAEKIDFYSIFQEGVWERQSISDFQNVSDVVSFNGDLFFSSIGDGLYNYSSQHVITDIPNSSDNQDTVINELVVRRNLIASSFGNPDPLHVFDGEDWVSFSSEEMLGDELEELAVSETGIVWYKRNGGGVAFDVETRNAIPLAGLPGNLNDIEISLSDDPWVATENGPASFEDASFIFSNNQSILPSFENRTLFEGQPIQAIATDGGNRVWFATNRGLWIFDRNISNQEVLFTTENSPLPSDVVLDLAYNAANGEMFILTDKGLVSFRSASSNPISSHTNVRVFPNPVLPEYAGLVGIEGLATDVSLKITDINGHLVKELPVNGGSASWDLRNVRNGKVVTGIYLFFSSSSDGSETFVGKIAVIQ